MEDPDSAFCSAATGLGMVGVSVVGLEEEGEVVGIGVGKMVVGVSVVGLEEEGEVVGIGVGKMVVGVSVVGAVVGVAVGVALGLVVGIVVGLVDGTLLTQKKKPVIAPHRREKKIIAIIIQ